ncbi:YbaK/EbsC family protein [Aliifodinibius sp. S!AR15-10]|uniref:aminoacyl-tRNA deacylase n=1 Tax=Aliifodinibius sp. S!AR15-10 TaxID=2950437 RepID=UPI002854CF07|nr:YbaK/EbsC family protein [Aliifodinibius sp. S!AR15-10]MDR8390344.1 YbaK/EbsC family protein [Aliifodinibius sp. S!AR15-10]
MPLSRLTEYLDDNDKKYVVIKHSKAFTAQEVAASAHIPGREMAKTVILKVDGDLKMLVLPSTHDVDFDQVKEQLGAKEVSLASEDEFSGMFPDCEVGAMPPFGNLYDMEVLVAESLTDDEEIAFNAGTHRELVRMAYQDFEDLANPNIVPVSVKHHY